MRVLLASRQRPSADRRNVAAPARSSQTMAHDVCAISHLLELHDDLLTNCAAQAAHAATLCRLSQSCKAFERLVLRDPSSAELVWAPALAHARLLADGSSSDGRATDGARTASDGSGGALQPEAILRPSAALYRALATVELRWERAGLDVAGPQSLIKMALTGRTGGALCRLRGQLLLYGGTLNGNFGPVLGDLLCLDYARRERDAGTGVTGAGAGVSAEGRGDRPPTLAVRPASVTPRALEPPHPGARRGHTMTATR